MKKINNKGFTLIEMIIVMTIFGVVISLGYGVFNGSQRALTEQTEVFNGQTTMNLINKFLSKDLKVSQGISMPLDSSNNKIDDLQKFINNINNQTSNKQIQYRYEISLGEDNKIVTYRVNIELKNNNYIYSITRIDENNSTIEILSNKTSFKNGNIIIPFTINLEGASYNDNGEYTNGGIYNIEVSYKEKNKQNIYSFSVKSRIG